MPDYVTAAPLQKPIWRRIVVNGERVAYGERGEGPAILLIHGFPSSGRLNYARLVPLLPADRRVIAIDLAGLGFSSRKREGRYDLRSQAARLLATLDALNVSRFDVVGSSMGGAVAQHLALLAPERVQALILLAPLDAGERPGRGAVAFGFLLGSLLVGAKLPLVGASVRARLARPEAGFTADWTREDALRASSFAGRRGTVRSALKVLRDSADAPRLDISTIRLPTLVVSGARDWALPAKVGEGIVAKIAGARRVIIADAGHSLAREHPQAVANLITSFLAEQAPHLAGG